MFVDYQACLVSDLVLGALAPKTNVSQPTGCAARVGRRALVAIERVTIKKHFYLCVILLS